MKKYSRDSASRTRVYLLIEPSPMGPKRTIPTHNLMTHLVLNSVPTLYTIPLSPVAPRPPKTEIRNQCFASLPPEKREKGRSDARGEADRVPKGYGSRGPDLHPGRLLQLLLLPRPRGRVGSASSFFRLEGITHRICSAWFQQPFEPVIRCGA